uniref:Uncharacterized protein n=1 Tax=Plectus sambesii TaxID=2011161 RepID=A0A914VUU3_9BILA
MGAHKSKSANISSARTSLRDEHHGVRTNSGGIELTDNKKVKETEEMDELKAEVAGLDERLTHFRAKMDSFLERHREVQQRLYEAEERAATAEQYKEWYENALADKCRVESQFEELQAKYAKLREKVKENESSSNDSEEGEEKVKTEPLKPTRKVKK